MAKAHPQSEVLNHTSRWKADDRTLETLTVMDCGKKIISTREQRCVKVDKEGRSSADLEWGNLWRRECPSPAPGNLAQRRRNIRGLRQGFHLVSQSWIPVSYSPAFFLQKDLESPGTWCAFLVFPIMKWSRR